MTASYRLRALICGALIAILGPSPAAAPQGDTKTFPRIPGQFRDVPAGRPDPTPIIAPTLAALRDFIMQKGFSPELGRTRSGERYLVLKHPLRGNAHLADCDNQTSINSRCKKMYLQFSITPSTRTSTDRVFFWNSNQLWNPNVVRLQAEAVAYVEKDGRVTLVASAGPGSLATDYRTIQRGI
jgi:hypothetical protein